jgi:hypothetical protein
MAEIVVSPPYSPVARPEPLIVATFTSLDPHVTKFVISSWSPALVTPIAMNWPVSFTDPTF